MAAWLPLPSGFTGYATRFVDPALGFCLGWNYWFKVRERFQIQTWHDDTLSDCEVRMFDELDLH